MPLRAVPPDVVELVKAAVVPVDDQHVAVLVGRVVDVAGIAALDPVRLRDRLVGNRVEGKGRLRRVVDAVALRRLHELHRLLRLVAVHDDVREAVDADAVVQRAAEVRMEVSADCRCRRRR